MSDLPSPVPTPTPQSVDLSDTAVPKGLTAPPRQTEQVDTKSLRAQCTNQIEAAILQTTTKPVERAAMIHDIKAAYIKTVFGIDIEDSR